MTHRNILISLLMTALLATGALADGWDYGSDYNQKYNPDTVQTLHGKIVKVDRDLVLEPGMAPGVVALVDTGSEIVTVHVGPRWFTDFYRDQWHLESGDQVDITGSVVNLDVTKTMLLRSGKKGEMEMVIRQKDGAPVWDAQRGYQF